MTAIIETFEGSLQNSEGETLDDSLVLEHGVERTADGVKLPRQITLTADSPEEYIILHQIWMAIQDSLGELTHEASYPSIYDGKEFVC